MPIDAPPARTAAPSCNRFFCCSTQFNSTLAGLLCGSRPPRGALGGAGGAACGVGVGYLLVLLVVLLMVVVVAAAATVLRCFFFFVVGGNDGGGDVRFFYRCGAWRTARQETG